MLTRDKEQILLNELHAFCLEAADHYQASASKTCVADMAPLLLDAAQMHQDFAGQLAERIRANDDQPKMPDSDRETLGLLFTSIRSRLSGNERQALMEDQVRMEEKLAGHIATALECRWPQDVRALLENILAGSNSMRNILRNAE